MAKTKRTRTTLEEAAAKLPGRGAVRHGPSGLAWSYELFRRDIATEEFYDQGADWIVAPDSTGRPCLCAVLEDGCMHAVFAQDGEAEAALRLQEPSDDPAAKRRRA